MGDGVTQEDLNEAVHQILNGVTAVSSVLSDRLGIAETTIDSLEKQLAAITVSFGEVSSIAEALVDRLSREPEILQEQFKKDLKRHRAEFLKTLRGQVGEMGEHDPEFAKAMAGLAGEQHTDTE